KLTNNSTIVDTDIRSNIKLVRTFLNTTHSAYTDTLCCYLPTTWIKNYKNHLCSTSLNMKTNSLFQLIIHEQPVVSKGLPFILRICQNINDDVINNRN